MPKRYAARRTMSMWCHVCHATYQSSREDSKTCSAKCRKKLSRKSIRNRPSTEDHQQGVPQAQQQAIANQVDSALTAW